MKKIFSNSLIVSVCLFLSKILGFVRDLLLASFFGSGPALQAFLVAFRFPEFMRKVTSSGTLTQIVNPYIIGKKSEQEKQFIATIFYFVAIFMLLLMLLAILFSSLWVDLYAYGLVDDKSVLKLVKAMFVIMIPYVFFNCIMGLITAILNSYKRYLVSSLLPVVLNILMIIGIISSRNFAIPIFSVAYSVLLAGIVQVVIGGYFLYKLIGRLNINRSVLLLKDSTSRIFLKKLPIAFFGTAILQINALVETFFASFLISGSLAWLYYADRVNQFLYGVFGTAIATVMLPYLIECKSDITKFLQTLAWVVRYTLIITVPAIVGLCLLAKPIVITLFYYGKFNLNDIDSTYLAMLGYLLSLFCFVIVRVVVSALYVQNKTTTVFYVGIFCLFLTLILDTYIVIYLSTNKFAFVYLALVSSTIALLNLFIQLFILVNFRVKTFFATYLHFATILRIIVACLSMIFVLKLFNLNDIYWLRLSMFDRFESLAMIIVTGIATYLLVILCLGGLKSLKTIEQ